MSEVRGIVSDNIIARYEQRCAELHLADKGKLAGFLEAMLDLHEVQAQPDIPALTLDSFYEWLALGQSPTTLETLEEEKAKVTEALALDYVSFKQLLRTGVLAEARRACSHEDRLKERLKEKDISDPNVGARIRGGGYLRVADQVHKWMLANLEATSLDEKIYISAGQLAKATGTNRRDINLYLEAHQAELDAHHQMIGFATKEEGDRHNRKRAAAMRWPLDQRKVKV